MLQDFLDLCVRIDFMVNLDSPEEIDSQGLKAAVLSSSLRIKKLDTKGVSTSIELLGKQCQQVWEEVSELGLPREFADCRNIVVCGMGGSTLGTHVIHSLYFDQLKTPLEIVNGYHLPSYVDKNSLVVLSSYSGTTEEVLACFEEAKKRDTKILAISSGGNLGKLVKEGKAAGYVFEPKYNPSGQPRMGLGYSILGQILIFSKLGFLAFSESDFSKVLSAVEKINSQSKSDVDTSQNQAKQIALEFKDKIPFLFASEHLVGNIHVFANQINENAKSLSCYFALPEANHHLTEGLSSPEGTHDKTIFFLLKSSLYSERVLKRYEITKNIVGENGIKTAVFEPQSQTKLEQVFEFLTFGSWVSFYLAMVYGRDPSPIPNVDSLKSAMATASPGT